MKYSNLVGLEFSSFDVCRKLKLARRRLREWIERGYIIPSVQQAAGVGTKNVFDLSDVYRIALFERLITGGFSREEAAQSIDHLVRNSGGKLLRGGAYIVFTRGREAGQMQTRGAYWRLDADNLHHLLQADDADEAYVLNFSKLAAEVDKLLE